MVILGYLQLMMRSTIEAVPPCGRRDETFLSSIVEHKTLFIEMGFLESIVEYCCNFTLTASNEPIVCLNMILVRDFPTYHFMGFHIPFLFFIIIESK